MTGTYRQLIADIAETAARRTLARAGTTEPTTEQLAESTRCALRHLVPVLQREQPHLFTALLDELRTARQPA